MSTEKILSQADELDQAKDPPARSAIVNKETLYLAHITHLSESEISEDRAAHRSKRYQKMQTGNATVARKRAYQSNLSH